jgi:hypothetical protein
MLCRLTKGRTEVRGRSADSLQVVPLHHSPRDAMKCVMCCHLFSACQVDYSRQRAFNEQTMNRELPVYRDQIGSKDMHHDQSSNRDGENTLRCD